jgi:hypothetical protein
VTEIFIDHPDEWIGIPEDWDETRWESAYPWASELVDALAESFGPAEGTERATLRDVLVTVAGSLDTAIASRLYVSVDGWTGPMYVATMAMLPLDLYPGATVEELAGAEDEDVVEKPIVEPYSTDGGLVGVKCVRYTNDDSVGGILAKADYVVHTPDAWVRFATANYDLVAFERVQPRMDRLARTVTVRD